MPFQYHITQLDSQSSENILYTICENMASDEMLFDVTSYTTLLSFGPKIRTCLHQRALYPRYHHASSSGHIGTSIEARYSNILWCFYVTKRQNNLFIELLLFLRKNDIEYERISQILDTPLFRLSCLFFIKSLNYLAIVSMPFCTDRMWRITA